MTEHLKSCALATCWLLACTGACSDDVATGRRCGTSRTQACARADEGAGRQAGGSRAGRESAAGSGDPAGRASDEQIGTPSGALGVRIEDMAEMTIEVVTLSCAGDCAEVTAWASARSASPARGGSTRRAACCRAAATATCCRLRSRSRATS